MDNATRTPTIGREVEELARALRGRLIRPDDAEYDEARAVWNGMIDRRPALIARCMGAPDVIRALDFARRHRLPVSVRSGGHNVAGRAVCDDGLMIDLSPMNEVRVDPEARTARVGPGARWQDLDRETQAFGLATTGGVHSGTGVAGLTLGGGLGYLARTYGLAVDNLLSAEVVLADGELVRASDEENPDLFWALRGGGGNFGIVTSFEFRLHEVGPEVLTAQLFHPFGDAGRVLRAYRRIMDEAPDELACYPLILRVPPVEPFPAEFHGEIALLLLACYSGAVEEGERALAPLRDLGDPFLAAVQPMAYATFQSSFDAGAPDGARYYYKSHYLRELSDEAIDTIVERTEPMPGPFTVLGIEPMGGAIGRVDASATAYPHRAAACSFSVWAGWSDPADDEAIVAWARGVHEAMAPYSTGGTYLNYLDRDDAGRIRDAYGENFDRLQRVKARYDPDGLFRVDQGLEPVA